MIIRSSSIHNYGKVSSVLSKPNIRKFTTNLTYPSPHGGWRRTFFLSKVPITPAEDYEPQC